MKEMIISSIYKVYKMLAFCERLQPYRVSLIHFHLFLSPHPLFLCCDILRQGDSEGDRKNKRTW